MLFPDALSTHPITLPDGTRHGGTVHLNRVLRNPNFVVGDYTYASDFDPPTDPADFAGRLAPYLFPGSREILRIGRYCQIAHGVRFITASANHAVDGVTTYPFPVFDPAEMMNFRPDTRDTVIGHDVWLGYGALVMPGARIGNGVIVGAGSVVRGTIPDYAIVTGNPATVLRLRFPSDEIDILNRLAWWDWSADQVAAARSALMASDLSALEAFVAG
ncbi:CatB-related O-acetyltransferase [Litoreibacter roseus]|uniref:Acetyltransferase n=1 Tax=Litoreibacter roseus TaxID=2601869 RepID=A0A6N6JG39_9RHOB|nr:CatB-related O-acetyltransferase [Litoreibacter roseus]GFE65311.1 acetyltransferase [Litoreibacter roseus]